MRVLVTGASGFIGMHAAKRLAGRGYEVLATGRDRDRLSPLEAIDCLLAEADLASDRLDALLEGADAVIHCAARASPWGKRAAFWHDNVLATERLLDAARRAGTVRRFVFISSPSIYFRYRDQQQLSEAFTPPGRWPTPYAETKWVAERRVCAVPELGPVVLRPRAVFGPGDRAIAPRLIAIARRGIFPLPGGGDAWVDLTYIDNVVDAIVRALEGNSDIEGRSFNITNGEPVQVRELVTRLFSLLGMPVRQVSVPRRVALMSARLSELVARMRPGQPEPGVTLYGIGLLAYTQTLSLEAARGMLGYVPHVSLQTGLERYAQWWKQQ